MTQLVRYFHSLKTITFIHFIIKWCLFISYGFLFSQFACSSIIFKHESILITFNQAILTISYPCYHDLQNHCLIVTYQLLSLNLVVISRMYIFILLFNILHFHFVKTITKIFTPHLIIVVWLNWFSRTQITKTD